jgi:peptidoglycan-associated lipoprotein
MHRSATRARIALALLPLLAAACATETPTADTNAAPGATFNLPSVPEKSFALHAKEPGKAAASTATQGVPAQRSVYYDLDRYEIKPEFRPAIEAHARYLRAHPSARVTIQGNGDERGSREYNLALGQRRAEGVRHMLHVSGVGERQMEAVSFGEEKPKATGHDEKSWAENRRSDLVYE